MSRKLFVVLAIMAIGLFMATSAMADLPGEAKAILLPSSPEELAPVTLQRRFSTQREKAMS